MKKLLLSFIATTALFGQMYGGAIELPERGQKADTPAQIDPNLLLQMPAKELGEQPMEKLLPFIIKALVPDLAKGVADAMHKQPKQWSWGDIPSMVTQATVSALGSVIATAGFAAAVQGTSWIGKKAIGWIFPDEPKHSQPTRSSSKMTPADMRRLAALRAAAARG